MRFSFESNAVCSLNPRQVLMLVKGTGQSFSKVIAHHPSISAEILPRKTTHSGINLWSPPNINSFVILIIFYLTPVDVSLYLHPPMPSHQE